MIRPLFAATADPIEEAREARAAERRLRARLRTARQHGLQRRHELKLRRLEEAPGRPAGSTEEKENIMGNGFAGYGGIPVEIHDRANDTRSKGQLTVRTCWTHSDNWVELTWRGDDTAHGTIYLDDADKVDFTAIMLEVLGEEKAASFIRAKSEKLAEKEEVRQRAHGEFRAASQEATKAFLEATAEQRAAFEAAVDRIEEDYEQATGDRLVKSRMVDLSASDSFGKVF